MVLYTPMCCTPQLQRVATLERQVHAAMSDKHRSLGGHGGVGAKTPRSTKGFLNSSGDYTGGDYDGTSLLMGKAMLPSR